jgi:putative acyl-CoA dehydrogenase
VLRRGRGAPVPRVRRGLMAGMLIGMDRHADRTLPASPDLGTHVVENQPGAPPGDLLADGPLAEALARYGGDLPRLAAYAARIGGSEGRALGQAANRHPPELVLFDRGGRRLDEVRFHPAWHTLLAAGLEAGYAGLPWTGGRHVTHAAMVYMTAQVEPGVCCPMTMTYAAVPALAGTDLAETWIPRLTACAYDPRVAPVSEKRAATLGMAMTEKQGGSDVRANTTRAEPADGVYRLTGHKWFCSAPMSDGFLTLAQAPGGLTCFLVPRWLPDGRNAIRLMRLKDKLGNRSNASAEIEYAGAVAHRVGEEGRGVAQILRMVHHTRLDTALAPAGLMRAALAEAIWWAQGRTAFQRRLIDQPLMRAVLADIALDVEAAVALGFRVAEAFDRGETAFARVAVALAKYLANKRAPAFIAEAMECLGGMGFVEDTPLPLLYREAPLNGIWEGSGNVICLDVLRTLAREPAAAAALAAELDLARGDRDYDRALAAHRTRWPGVPSEAEARLFAERTAHLLAGSLLLRHATPVGEAYVATRLAADRGLTPGAVTLDDAAVLARAAS